MSDTFGAALLDALGGGAGRHCIERDDGEAAWFDATDYLDTPEDWWPEMLEALDRLQGRVLDVGCGAGRHALYLAERGCAVVGIDPSPGAVEVCRRRGVQAIAGRLGAVELGERCFDAVVMLGNGLGLLGSPERARAHLRWLADRCVAGGTLVGEARDPRVTDKPANLAYHARQRTRGKPIGQVRLRVCFDGQLGEWFEFWHMTPDELAAVVAPTQWRVESVTGASSYIAVLRKTAD